jgi:hypothetical protein
MESEYRQSFGCCSNLPETLLHTGDRWDYPKWYIRYIRGEGDKKLPKNVHQLLEYLSDGGWKVNTGKSGIGMSSQEASIELELIQMSPVTKPFRIFIAKEDYAPITDIEYSLEFTKLFEGAGNGFIGAYRITERGRNVLAENRLP